MTSPHAIAMYEIIGHHHGGNWAGWYPMPPWRYTYPAGYAGPDILIDPEFGIVNPEVLRHRVSGYEILGSISARSMRAMPSSDWIEAPTAIITMPYKAPTTRYDGNITRVLVYGGKYWWSELGNSHMYNDPKRVTVYFKNGTHQTYDGLEALTVFGGARANTGAMQSLLIGADYTDAFMTAKQEVDDVLTHADSIADAAQHAGVASYLAQEAKIVEGFRRGVDTKDKKLVDSATNAMKQLAATARQFFIDPSTGKVKSQTREAATETLAKTGGDLAKFKDDISDTMKWLKWIAIGGGVLLVLAIGGSILVPIVFRRRWF